MSSQYSDPSTPDRGRLPHHREVPFQSPNPSTPSGEKILRRLREELFLWLITVDATGTPHTLPLGFLWDEAQSSFLIYGATMDLVTATQNGPSPASPLVFSSLT